MMTLSKNIGRLWMGAFLLLFLFSGCNRSKSSGDAAQKQDVVVDSLFVKNYIAAVPQFNEYRDLMFLFYGERDYRLAWFRNDKLIPEANRFLEAIDKSERDGFDPKEYKVKDLPAMFAQFEALKKNDTTRLQLQKEIDVALTASYFNFASDFYRGKINPQEVESIEWSVKQNKIKLHRALQTILRERDSRYPYYQFEALHEGYVNLRSAFNQYRAIKEKGGWPKIEGFSGALKRGDSSPAVPLIRQRLLTQEEIEASGNNNPLFDERLDLAVKSFQERHGLKPDGAVGGETLKQMNVSIDDRIDQILLNMERWRWVPKRFTPKELPQKHIFVNIPEYKMYVYEEGEEVMNMRVIVGKEMHATPIFSDKMEYVVMAPYWNVPVSIVVSELAPKLARNPNFLESQDMELLNGMDGNAQPMSPAEVDWNNVTEENFKFLIRQRPGPKNSLGLVKFLFPNEHAVYLHDTPTASLFSQTDRGFSHGCVRIEEPAKLANYLLKDHKEGWNEQKIKEAMTGKEEKWVTLEEKVPVYIVYFTAWVDKAGAVHFRDDLYGHDKALAQAYFE